ncbi:MULTISPECIES: hypothetical protein [Bartonella]|uniref:Lipoprotein n=1 Tax=Bartonella choladocola TaxID=2750995 RepID=A0A1U9MI21_9HYPH|nr:MULTISPECIES: hypothetical protein [Bartonella]AQT47373.1 hypothetical protein BBC0122_012620 [Bartonella choladocola]MBH9975538.1 hypothetical protein [Bartonella choladocola]MBI0015145.1 hypothetical protein [Bartonella sp. B10834G3]MBI0140726.1 hypothetical protein [Bartonella choladocola]
MKIRILTTCSFLTLVLGMNACTQKAGPGNIELASGQPALKTMEHVAQTANRCWFKSDKAEFKRYGFEPELQSYSGRPRMLIVPKSTPGGKPVLVVEAEGNPARVSVYGPLMAAPQGNAIGEDIDRWVKGDNQC